MLLNAQTSVHNTASTRFCMCAQIYTLTGRQLVIGLQTGLRLCTLFFLLEPADSRKNAAGALKGRSQISSTKASRNAKP